MTKLQHLLSSTVYTSLLVSQQCCQTGEVISTISNHNFRRISRNLNAKYPQTMSHTLNITVKQRECNRYVICFSAHRFFCFVFNFPRTHVKSDEGLNTTHASIHVLVLDTKIFRFKLNFTAIKLSN